MVRYVIYTMKFKEGDVVRFIDNHECDSYRTYNNLYGQVGKVVKVISYEWIEWLVYGDQESWHSMKHQLELAKPYVVKQIVDDLLDK